MASFINLVITSNTTAADFKSQCNLSMLGLDAVNNFAAWVAGLAGGTQAGAKLQFEVGSIQSSGTLTVASTGSTNNQTCAIGGVTLTAKTASTANNEFSISATPATQAAAMAACINASTNLAGIVTATSALGVVTVTSVQPGKDANSIAISAGTLSNVTASGAQLTGGSDGTSYIIDLR